MKMNCKPPKEFLAYQKKLKASIKAMGINQSHIYKGIGMSKATWDRRLKQYNFTAQELIKVCELINGDKT